MNPRPLLFLVALLVASVVAPEARAGTYAVPACHGTSVPNRSWTVAASPHMAAYDACPIDNFRPHATGLVNRPVVSAGVTSVPGFSFAKHRFDAPAGTSLASVTFDAGFYAGGDPAFTGWRAGVWGITPAGSAVKVWGDCPYGQCAGLGAAVAGPFTVDLSGFTAVEFLLICGAGSCPATPQHQGSGVYHPFAWMNTGNVTARVRDDGAPTFDAIGGTLWRDGWHRGREHASHHLSDASGLASSWFDVDGQRWDSSAPACDYTLAAPCPTAASGNYALDTTSVADGAHVVRLGATDAAGNASQVQERTVWVDNHAPAAPAAPSLDGGEGWRRAAGFALAWTNPPGQVAPITLARWRACRAEAHGGGCVDGQLAGKGVQRLDGSLAPGDWTLRVRLEDEAGNADPEAVSDPVHVRYDPAGPDTLGFLAPDPDDPRTVHAVIADAISGPAGGQIELRRAGESGAWSPLPTQFSGDRLVTRIDEDALVPGVYRFRVVGRDAAGNERVTDRVTDGADAGSGLTLTIPLRTQTRLALTVAPGRAIKRTCRRVRVARRTVQRCANRAVTVIPPAGRPVLVPFGSRKGINGRLTTAAGAPVAEQPVGVRVKPFAPGAAEREVATVKTDREGRLTYSAPHGSSRAIRFVYPGNQVLGPASASQGLLVRASLTLAANRRELRNRGTVRFTGRLRGTPVPARGKLVNLQAHYRGKWRTFVTVRSDRNGRFAASYRFEVTVGRVVYPFRAQARREGAYPYELGHSPAVSVTVRG